MHLICGAPGAGKTTYAAALAARVRGLKFSLDDWMASLFLADRPTPPTLNWAKQRIDRCEAMIWSIAVDIVGRNVDVVLDFGFARQDHRDAARMKALQVRARPRLHYLDVDPETRLARVRERNLRGEGVYAVSDAMFEQLEKAFEVPTDDELVDAMIIGD